MINKVPVDVRKEFDNAFMELGILMDSQRNLGRIFMVGQLESIFDHVSKARNILESKYVIAIPIE